MLARADFLRVVSIGGVGLTLGLEFMPLTASAEAATTFSPSAWVSIGTDGKALVTINKAEMGQGVATSLPMCLADELDLPLDHVRFAFADMEERFYDAYWKGMLTGGSTSMKTMSPVFRKAGATARAMLVSAAAKQWGVDPATLTTANGVVSSADGKHAAYGELVALAATLPVPTDVALKHPDQFKLIGTHQKRLDLRQKTNGQAGYGIDVKVPGMKYASIEKPPAIGGGVKSFDATAAMKIKGVRKVAQISSGIVVIADNTWAAFAGRRALHVVWEPGPNGHVNSDDLFAKARVLSKQPGAVLRKNGDLASAPSDAKTLTATYEQPYLAHATMEPMNATASWTADGVEMWAPMQAPTTAQAVISAVLKVPMDKIKIHSTFLGGGFGRRLEPDFMLDAVEASRVAGAPVKVTWTREDDTQHDLYRSMHVNALEGKLAPDGTLVGLKHTVVTSSVTARVLPALMKDGVDPLAGAGAADAPYNVPNVLVDFHLFDTGIPVGFWRAPYANANTFATESFIDELAHAAGKDPVAFRLAMMTEGSRARTVLEAATKRANWGGHVPAGRARGVAVGFWDSSVVAVVAEVSQPTKETIKVHHAWCAVDCGQPINLDGLDQQLTSSMLYGLSAALSSKITFKNGAVEQSNFYDYRVIHMADSPAFDVQVMKSTDPSSGAGEIGTPAIIPAVANALFALSGKRIRNLPLLENLA
jgi:isoquinoline 1-oxidoreductase beta subunit